ncbi:guanine nucleotide-binding protein alpha-1 subunit [Pelomyxa schiedti]|nr:guanine nucleotide-binding protein alpha-1 subunit [Pelomyxa schiedti]
MGNTAPQKGSKSKRREIKILLLGAGDSGKSTLVKQMHVIHLEGFTDAQKKEFRPIIYSNLISFMVTLVQATRDFSIPVSPGNEAAAQRFLQKDKFGVASLNPEIARDIKILWSDPGILAAFARAREFQLPDSAAYYFKSIDRLAAPDYMPTDTDILHTPSHTTGFNEVVFHSHNERFRVVDVGGQRSERRKWVQCFQDVSAVVFCAALSEYDLTLFEKADENRTHESLKLFHDVCASKWFANSQIFLFLNKKDLFDQKVSTSPLSIYFPQYSGPNEPDPAAEFIRDLFLTTASCGREVQVFYTCATNSDNVREVFNMVLQKLLQHAAANAEAEAAAASASSTTTTSTSSTLQSSGGLSRGS